VVQISDDNAARAVDHSRDRALSISSGSSVTRLMDSGYVRVVTDFEDAKGREILEQ
jgi:hypothetical protein